MRKEVRNLVKEAESIGWRDTGKFDSKGLHILEHENGQTYRLTANPNEHHTLTRHRKDLETIAGRKLEGRGNKRRRSHKKIESSGFDVDRARREQEDFHRDREYDDPERSLVYATATKRSSAPLPPVDCEFPDLEKPFEPVTRLKRIKPYVDSVDGKELPPSTEIFRISIKGRAVDLALCEDNLEMVEEVLGRLLGSADVHVPAVHKKRAERTRKARQKAGLKGPKAPEGLGVKIRAWLLEQGFEVGGRGRFRRDHLEAYFNAHPEEKYLVA